MRLYHHLLVRPSALLNLQVFHRQHRLVLHYLHQHLYHLPNHQVCHHLHLNHQVFHLVHLFLHPPVFHHLYHLPQVSLPVNHLVKVHLKVRRFHHLPVFHHLFLHQLLLAHRFRPQCHLLSHHLFLHLNPQVCHLLQVNLHPFHLPQVSLPVNHLVRVHLKAHRFHLQ